MKPHRINKASGCTIHAVNSKEWDIGKRHRRARIINGKLVSRFAPGTAVELKKINESTNYVLRQGFGEGLRAIEKLIGRTAMEALTAANNRGEHGFVALLHACKGACVDMQDFEMASEFRDMADAVARRVGGS